MKVIALILIFALVFEYSNCTPTCEDMTREYIVENCVRYRCLFGVATMEPCPNGLAPSAKVYTGCEWPKNSECTSQIEIGKITDPCAGNPCINGGRCIASASGQTFLCACVDGFEGPRCEMNTNDCLSSPCENGGICVDQTNDFTCQCPAASGDSYYTGKRCETKIGRHTESSCNSQPCQNDGYCMDTGGGRFICYCRAEFTGPLCNQTMDAKDPCSAKPCLNSGICTSIGANNYRCFCTPGFTGQRCEQGQDPCSIRPCMNGGVCVRTEDLISFACQCPAGFSGNLCETAEAVNPCSNNPCKNDGYCMNMRNSYKCYCRSGFTGPDCSLSVENLISNQCSSGTDLIAHPDQCQLYYNCSEPNSRLPGMENNKYLAECPYPKLFSEETMQCEDFYATKCGKRREVLDYCSYLKQRCTAKCKPCHLYHPSCQNLPDGLHPNPYKPNSPYFISCFRNRTMYADECGLDRFGKKMIFFRDNSASSGSCTSVFEISRASGGRKPECSGNSFGIFPDPDGNCERYYFCQNGEATFLQCDGGQVFSYDPGKMCHNPSDVCKPCGVKNCDNQSDIVIPLS